MARASAAELLSLSVRQIKRLKKRCCEGWEAALARANRGRPSHLRLPAQLTAPGFQEDASGKILEAQFFRAETTEGYFTCLLRRFAVPAAFYGDRSSILVRYDGHWTVEEELDGLPANGSRQAK